jgi:ankyrin repeat protein
MYVLKSNQDGLTPIDVAASNEMADVVAFLKDVHADTAHNAHGHGHGRHGHGHKSTAEQGDKQGNDGAVTNDHCEGNSGSNPKFLEAAERGDVEAVISCLSQSSDISSNEEVTFTNQDGRRPRSYYYYTLAT